MKTKSYSAKLKDPRWQRKRLEVMERDKFTCQICGDTETSLQVHHIKYQKGKEPWDYPNDLLVTLCKHCHVEVEEINKTYRRDKFDSIKIHKNQYNDTGKRIMFTSFKKDRCVITVYDSDDILIAVFGIKDDAAKLIEVLQNVL